VGLEISCRYGTLHTCRYQKLNKMSILQPTSERVIPRFPALQELLLKISCEPKILKNDQEDWTHPFPVRQTNDFQRKLVFRHLFQIYVQEKSVEYQSHSRWN